MLEGLKNVQWKELSHAYGEASDVPKLLQTLTSDKEEVRKEAISTLFTNIYHQGTVYQASAYTAPFLIDLLMHPTVQGKEDLLFLLSHLASGDGYNHQHLNIYEEGFLEKGPTFLEDMEEQLYWVRKTHEAVSEGLKIYLSLLEHVDPKVKMGAAYLLAHLPEHASRTIFLLYALFKSEGSEIVRANLVFCLAALDIESERVYQFAREHIMDADHEFLRLAASLVTVRSGRNDIQREAIDLLIQVAMHEKEVDDTYATIPWVEWRISIEALRALQWLNHQPAQYTINHLVAALHAYLTHFAQEKGYDIWQYRSSKDFIKAFDYRIRNVLEVSDDIARQQMFENLRLNVARYSQSVLTTVDETFRTLTYLAFRNEKLREGSRFQDLSPEQQLMLTALADCGLAWHCIGGRLKRNTGEWVDTIRCVVDLYSIGLPDMREELQAFIQAT